MLALGFYLIFGVAVLITIGCAHRRLKHHQALDEAEMRAWERRMKDRSVDDARYEL